MPLTNEEKHEAADKYMVPIANAIRQIEREAVEGASHRKIEVTAVCLHVLLDDLRKHFNIPFKEADVNPSVYGENGSK